MFDVPNRLSAFNPLLLPLFQAKPEEITGVRRHLAQNVLAMSSLYWNASL